MGLIKTGVGIAGAIGVIHAVSKAVERHESNKAARAPGHPDQRSQRNDLPYPSEQSYRNDLPYPDERSYRRDLQYSNEPSYHNELQYLADLFGPPRHDQQGYAAQGYPALDFQPRSSQGGYGFRPQYYEETPALPALEDVKR